jgi:hypothetical protein
MFSCLRNYYFLEICFVIILSMFPIASSTPCFGCQGHLKMEQKGAKINPSRTLRSSQGKCMTLGQKRFGTPGYAFHEVPSDAIRHGYRCSDDHKAGTVFQSSKNILRATVITCSNNRNAPPRELVYQVQIGLALPSVCGV